MRCGETVIVLVTMGLIASVHATPPSLIPVPPALAPDQENQAPLLTWVVPPGAVSYVVDLGLPPACESIAKDVAVEGSSYQSPRLPDGDYCWRVRAVDANGNEAVLGESYFTTIPAFGQWGMVLMLAAMVGYGVWELRRKAATKASSDGEQHHTPRVATP